MKVYEREREREGGEGGREGGREREDKELYLPHLSFFTLHRGQPKPTPRKPRVPRKNVGTPDRSLSHQSSQGSIPPSPSSSTSSLASPTISESEEPSLAKKSVDFELPSIPEGKSEGTAENDNDVFLESLRRRRMDAKVGLKPKTAGADISTEKGSGLTGAPSSTAKSYSRTTFQRDSDPLSQSSPSLSSLRRPLTPPRVEPLPQTTPTPTLTPSGQGKVEEESDDSSSDKYSTPPMTAEHPATITTVNSGHTPQDTPTLVTPSDDTSEHDPVLEEFRRRRLELKQQREQSGKKSDASDSPPTTTETKTETKEKVETLPPSVVPTQLSTAANSSQYIGGGDESRQTSTVDTNSSLFTGVYCPKCHCKVLLGQKYCSYCGEAVYMLFTNKKPPTGSPATGSAANGSIANVPTYQDRNKSTNYNEGVDTSVYYSGTSTQPGGGQMRSDPRYQPESNALTLPPKPGPRSPSKVTAAAEQSFLYDSSGRPMRASVPPEDDAAAKQPPLPSPSPSSHHQQHQAALQQHQLQKKPLRARVDASAAGGGGVASAGASGYAPSPPVGAGILQYSEKLKRFREFLHKKGKSDTEIDNDPDYLLMVEEERKKQPKGSVPSLGNASGYSSTTAAGAPGHPNAPTGSAKVDRYGGQQSGLPAHKPNVGKYDRVNLLASDNYSSENQRAMEKLKDDGQQLLHWIKV